MRSATLSAVAVALTLAACQKQAPPETAARPAAHPLLLQARDALKRAETAPLPTPPPPPSPVPRGWKPQPAPDLKPEEIEAIRLLEQAASAQPPQADVHELLARTLEPHAVRVHERALAGRGRKTPLPLPPDPGVDVSPARVSRAYRAAIEADPQSRLIDTLVEFAGRVDDLDAMDWAHQERIRRAREKDTVTPRVLYGDFLRDRRRDALAAAEQYRGALMWKPEDAGIRDKLADIYLTQAKEHYDRREYAGAEVRLREAAKYALDAASPQGLMLADYRQRLSSIRR